MMNFRLADTDWRGLINQAYRNDHSRVRIVCPFIKEQAVLRILELGQPNSPHVELTSEAIAWLNPRFQDRIERFGRISQERMSKLDWPVIPDRGRTSE